MCDVSCSGRRHITPWRLAVTPHRLNTGRNSTSRASPPSARTIRRWRQDYCSMFYDVNSSASTELTEHTRDCTLGRRKLFATWPSEISYRKNASNCQRGTFMLVSLRRSLHEIKIALVEVPYLRRFIVSLEYWKGQYALKGRPCMRKVFSRYAAHLNVLLFRWYFSTESM
jgi:hypothetical protein